MHKYLYLILFFLVIILHKNYSQSNILDQQYTVAQLKEDLSILRTQLEKVHIGLYTYTPKKEMDQFFEDLEEGITHPMTSLEFFRYLSPINVKIRNGHSAFLPSREIINSVRTEQKIFPLKVYWNEGKLYVLKNLSQNDTIQDGMIIKRINGRPADLVFQEMADRLWRDGYNKTSPETIVSERFYHLYPFLKDIPDYYDVEVETSEGISYTIQLAAQSSKILSKIEEEKYGKESYWMEDDTPALALKIEGKIATMTIRSFDAAFVRKAKNQKIKKFYKSAFTKMEQAGVEHLILDLRDNGGGDPLPTIDLFAYLHPEPFTFYKDITLNVKRLPDRHLYEVGLWDRLSLFFGTKKRGDIYELSGLAKTFFVQGLKPSKPKKPHYDGKLYVLTNARSFSATGEMTAIIKNYNRAIFIGEEPSGNPNENVSGIMLPMFLPHTKNQIIMSLMRWEMNVDFENTGRGVLPDYPIRPSIQDKLAGRDTVMEFTMDLIKRN